MFELAIAKEVYDGIYNTRKTAKKGQEPHQHSIFDVERQLSHHKLLRGGHDVHSHERREEREPEHTGNASHDPHGGGQVRDQILVSGNLASVCRVVAPARCRRGRSRCLVWISRLPIAGLLVGTDLGHRIAGWQRRSRAGGERLVGDGRPLPHNEPMQRNHRCADKQRRGKVIYQHEGNEAPRLLHIGTQEHRGREVGIPDRRTDHVIDEGQHEDDQLDDDCTLDADGPHVPKRAVEEEDPFQRQQTEAVDLGRERRHGQHPVRVAQHLVGHERVVVGESDPAAGHEDGDPDDAVVDGLADENGIVGRVKLTSSAH